MAVLEIITLPQFEKEILLLARKYPLVPDDYEKFLTEVQQTPFAGDSLGNNCYKKRMKIASKRTGKDGGCKNNSLCQTYK